MAVVLGRSYGFRGPACNVRVTDYCAIVVQPGRVLECVRRVASCPPVTHRVFSWSDRSGARRRGESVTSTVGGAGQLLAISDLHVGYAENRELVERMRPETDDDWLLVAGDVAETVADIQWALRLLARPLRQGHLGAGQPRAVDPPRGPGHAARRRPLRAPGRAVPGARRGHARGPVPGLGGPRRAGHRRAAVPALRLLLPPAGLRDQGGGARVRARGPGVVCTDEYLLHPDPYPTREAWCRGPGRRDRAPARRAADRRCRRCWSTTSRWSAHPTECCATRSSRMWCGTELTADWHRRFRADGHGLRPPAHPADHLATTGSASRRSRVGYPREWRAAPGPPGQAAPDPAEEVEAGDRGDSCPGPVVAVEAHGVRRAAAGRRRCTPRRRRVVARAVDKRRREFTAVRGLRPPGPGEARRAAAGRSCPASAAPRGGRPAWSAA